MRIRSINSRMASSEAKKIISFKTKTDKTFAVKQLLRIYNISVKNAINNNGSGRIYMKREGKREEYVVEQLRMKGKKISGILMGLVIACFVTTAVLLALAFVMLKLQPDTGVIETAILVTYAVSCLFGGWYCGRKAERKKFLWGILLGVLYFLLLLVISGMGDRTVQSGLVQSLAALVICAGGGMLGGMLAK